MAVVTTQTKLKKNLFRNNPFSLTILLTSYIFYRITSISTLSYPPSKKINPLNFQKFSGITNYSSTNLMFLTYTISRF